MKKLLSILLCLSMLLCMLVSCEDPDKGKDDDTTAPETTAGKPAETRLRLIFPDGCSDALEDAVIDLKNALIDAGMDPLMVSDGISDNAANTDAEILVGATNRPASQEYLESAAENAYTVRQVGPKTVLAGATDALTVRAVKYFTENCLQDGGFEVAEDFDGTLDLSVPFMTDGEIAYTIKYQRGSSFLASLVDDLQTAIRGATSKEISYAYAPKDFSPDEKEILLGVFDYEAAEIVNQEMMLGGYAIAVSGNKIFISASDAASYEKAFAAFANLLKSNATGKGDERRIVLEDGYTDSALVNKDLAHMPNPTTYPDKIIQTADNGGWTAVYQKSTKAFFNDYCQKLEDAGFTEYATANFDGDTDKTKNTYATYVKGTNSVRIAYHAYNSRLYLTTTPLTETVMPLTTVPTFTNKTSTHPIAFVQVGEADLRSSPNSSMCYIMRLADGSFFIVDGNLQGTSGERIYQILKKMAPDPKNIVISGWLITHAHGDHIAGYKTFMTTYKNDSTITLKQFLHNFPAQPYASDGSAHHNTLINLAKEFDPDVEILRVHAGDVVHLPGVDVNVLYTQEEYLGYQDAMLNYNAASVVTQLVTMDGSKILIGADHPVEDAGGKQYGCEQAIWTWYGTFIQSDMVTTFHHGLGGGADGMVYDKIAPSVVFWCCDLGTINTHSLNAQGRNAYFKKEGVKLYVSDDNIQIAYFEKGNINVMEYMNFNDFRLATVK